jgi:hypothetical protein
MSLTSGLLSLAFLLNLIMNRENQVELETSSQGFGGWLRAFRSTPAGQTASLHPRLV